MVEDNKNNETKQELETSSNDNDMDTQQVNKNENLSIWSKTKKNIEATIANKTTITAPVSVSFPVGQETLKASFLTPCINLNGLIILFL